MRRFYFVFLIVCQLFGTIYSTGPKYIPTKGQVWPSPQQENKNESVYFVFQPSQMNINISYYTCGLITRAIERYNFILNDLELLLNSKYLNKEQEESNNENQKHEILKELRIELSLKCEETPHYEMNEKYHLKVDKVSVLKSSSIWGILRGLETFVQLFYFPDDYSEIRINATNIYDFPQYKHRGLLIDTSRHYVSLSNIYKTIDALAMNKMNVLHWHITDDQSFPYQSELFPTLSEKGAYFPSMVYTKNDIRSVVEFARDRGVRVIPEIDVPGHTRSWGEAFPHLLTACYDEYNKVTDLGPLDPTNNKTYEFLQQLFHEVHQWFPDDFFHLGGDEVNVKCWNSNPNIKAYLKKHNMAVDKLQGHFMRKTIPLLPKQTKPVVWQEVFDMQAIPTQKTHVQVWNFGWIKEMDKVLNAGHYVIFSSSWYLDYHNPSWQEFYRADPRQMVYRLRHNSTGLENIVGGEACMWGEMADDTNILSKTWPRTSAVAERLWTGLDYKNFLSDPVTDEVTRRIEEHTCRMKRRGISAQPPNGPSFCVGV